MIELAPGVWQFRFAWRNAFNAYYVEHGDERVVVDASTRWDRKRMCAQLRERLGDRRPTCLVLTHAHPDHQGAAKCICETFGGVPLAVHEEDAPGAEGRARLVRQSAVIEGIGNLVWAGPRQKVGRLLREGDTVGGFRVYHMPGHTPGHIVLLREADGVAIVGDVLNNNHIITHRQHLHEPPWIYSWDVALNRQSIRRLLELRPSLLLFGHGPPMRGVEQLKAYVARLR